MALMRVLRRAVAALTSLPGRLLVSAALLAIVAASVDWGTLGETISGTKWRWFALAVSLVLAALAIGTLRWHALLRAAGLPVTLRLSARAYAIGAFSNNILPTGFGGDVVRGWLVAGPGRPLARALTSVGVDRMSALACLLLLGWLGVALDPGSIPGTLVAFLGIATAGFLAAFVLAIAILRRRGLGRLLPASLRPWAAEVADVLRGYGRDREVQVRAFLLGLAFQALMVGAAWALGEALRLGLDPAVFAVVIPLVLIATLAPISVAGFGVREGAFVALLAEVNIGASDATLFSLLSVAVMTIASLPGGIALAIRHERPQVPPSALESG